MTTGSQPSGNYGHSTVYDAKRQRLLVFGGMSRTRMINGVYNNREYFAYFKVGDWGNWLMWAALRRQCSRLTIFSSIIY